MNAKSLKFAIIVTGLSTFTAGKAISDAEYSADEVIKHFSQQVVEGGKKRALCIGTRDECVSRQDEDRQTSSGGFNLTVTFKFGSSELTPQAQANLDEFATALKDDRLSIVRFSIEGHTDAVGSEAANLHLSENRARSVARYLVRQGVELTKLEIQGFGETALAVPNDPNHVDNRRVEARLILE